MGWESAMPHQYNAGDVVTVFQISPSNELVIEGKATIRKRVAEVDEHYDQHQFIVHGQLGKSDPVFFASHNCQKRLGISVTPITFWSFLGQSSERKRRAAEWAP
jgi:hypothetical protein